MRFYAVRRRKHTAYPDIERITEFELRNRIQHEEFRVTLTAGETFSINGKFNVLVRLPVYV